MTELQVKQELATWEKVFERLDNDWISAVTLEKAAEHLATPSKAKRNQLLTYRKELIKNAKTPYHYAVNQYCAAVQQSQPEAVPEYLFWMKHYIREL